MNHSNRTAQKRSFVVLSTHWNRDALLSATTYFVDINAPGPTHDGSSWQNAFTDLQQALSIANPTGGNTVNIDVAKGTYTPTSTTDRTISFQLKNNVRLLGGFAGFGATNPNARDIAANSTILSGNIGALNNKSDNSAIIVIGSGTDASAVIDGFTISNATQDGSLGAAMFNQSGSPTISNCTFSGNTNTASGGGMYNYLNSSPNITNCLFNDNSASAGGGMINFQNSAPTLTNCSFSENISSGGGGAIYNGRDCSTMIMNCNFTDNKSEAGGAIVIDGSTPTLIGCTFQNNSADIAGAVYNEGASKFTNCIFVANSDSEVVCAFANFGGAPVLTNCTFTGNFGPANGELVIYSSNSKLIATNCIVWGNTATAAVGGGVVTYSDIQGGYTGTGNINADPQFVRNPSPGADGTWGTADDDYGNLHLKAGSPAVDAGNNSAVPAGATTDLVGNNRFIDIPGVRDPGAIVDMRRVRAAASTGDHEWIIFVQRAAADAELRCEQCAIHNWIVEFERDDQ